MNIYKSLNEMVSYIENQDIPYSIIEQKELVLYGKGTKTTVQKISKVAPEFFKKISEKFYDIYGEHTPYGMTVYEQFIPSCKYNLRPIPELEHYHNDVTDFLIPIED